MFTEPRHKKPYVLITSRDCKWNVRGEGNIEVIRLDEFGEIEALEFVRKTLNIRDNSQDKEIEELTRELQYFPLALEQAVVYIQDRNEESRLRGDKRLKISDYLKEYQQNAGELLKKGVYENEDRYTKTVLTTWNITMTYIRKEYGFEALNILEIMAYLAPDDIRIKEIFSKSIADDKEKLWNAVELLNRYSMIKLREGVANIHRLVQKVTELNLQKEGREEEVLRKALELVKSGDIAINHIVSIWEYASKYGKLIDDFYFRPIYSEQKYVPLHLLAESGDYEAVETLLTHIEERHTGRLGKVVNVKDEDGYTPLHLAAYSGKLDAVKCLVSKGAGINAKDKYGNTPLHMAAEGGKLDIAEHLTRNGADVNAEDKYDETPLCVAIRSGKLEIVKYFFNKGADIDKYDGTILHLAVCNEKPDIVEYLISKGVDVNAKYHKMPLHLAASRGLGGAMFFIQKGGNINTKSKNSNTSLHFAAIMGNVDIAKVLLKHNADVNTKNNEGKTALHYATDFDHSELVELLLAHGASHDY